MTLKLMQHAGVAASSTHKLCSTGDGSLPGLIPPQRRQQRLQVHAQPADVKESPRLCSPALCCITINQHHRFRGRWPKLLATATAYPDGNMLWHTSVEARIIMAK